MAILILCQNLGSAVFLTVAQTIFSNDLRKSLASEVPGVDADTILAGGARMLRRLVSGHDLGAVLKAYSEAIDSVMYLGVGLGVTAFACAWGMGFKNIKVKEDGR